jgi:hypothetical protein
LILMVLGFAPRARDPEAGVVGGWTVELAEPRVVIPGDAGRSNALLRVPAEGVNATGRGAAPALDPAVVPRCGVALRVSVEISESSIVSLCQRAWQKPGQITRQDSAK